MRHGAPDPQPCAGGIVLDQAGRLLLIRRGRPPSQGRWSIPGGRCLPDEPPQRACVREVREETGLDVTIVRWAGQVERSAPDGGTYLIDDYECALRDPAAEVRAGDDADDARWVDAAAFAALDLVPGLAAALTEWQLLPR